MGNLGNKKIMAENITYYMNKHQKSRNDMCEALGVKYTTFTDWVKGNSYPRIDKIELMANYFGISKADLVEKRNSTPAKSGVTINVLGRVAAGIPIDCVEEIIDTEEITQDMASTGEFFGLQIHGDSMEPRMKDGDVVIVRQQGGCKLTLNVKEGIIQEALVETIGCSGMTHSAAMASEILPGRTILEALNTDLVCDAINTAMRELFLQIVYGRTQSAFSEEGLPIGAGLEDLGKGLRSQVGTMYGTLKKGPRYLEMAEGYVTGIALDADDEIIGYQFVNFGRMMDFIKAGDDAQTALDKAKGQYGRVDDAVKIIDPRKE